MTDTGYAGNIIRCIAGQTHDIDHLAGFNTKRFSDSLYIYGFFLHRVPDNGLVGYKLHEILIPGNHHHGKPGFFSPAPESTDKIISLKTRHFHDQYIEPLGYFLYVRDLNRQIFRLGGTIGLVVLVDFMPEGRPLGIKKHSHMLWSPILNELYQHAGKSESCICWKTL